MLLIDVGNSRMKWAVLGSAGPAAFGVAILDAASLDAILLRAWPDQVPPQQVWISNVAGLEVAHRLRLAVRDRWDFDPRFVYAKPQAFGVHCAYKAPMRLGADRWAKLVAARATMKEKNTCILDSGTALTLDALDSTGQHLGGLIAPGFALMQRALLKETGGIRAALGAEPSLNGLEPEGFLGQDTAGCVGNGCFQAVVGFVQRALLMLRKRWPTGFTVLITGGDAGRLLPYLPRQTRHEQHLVLQGLAVIARWGQMRHNEQLAPPASWIPGDTPLGQNQAGPVRSQDVLEDQAGVAQSVERLPCKQ